MNNIKFKNFSKWLLKFGLSSLALFFVFKKVELNRIVEIALSADPFFLALAVLAFNGSKIISAFRLNQFYKAVEVNLTEKYNLALYYLSMFYNLFLPGSIGGDAYKVYLLKQDGKGSLKSYLWPLFWIESAVLPCWYSSAFYLFWLTKNCSKSTILFLLQYLDSF